MEGSMKSDAQFETGNFWQSKNYWKKGALKQYVSPLGQEDIILMFTRLYFSAGDVSPKKVRRTLMLTH